MNDTHGDAGLLTRREVLQRLTALAATSTLAGCPWPISPFPPPPPAAEIDIHCHIFNVRDLPAYAFILDVAVNTPQLKPMAAPIAKLMVEIVRDCAPDAAEELLVLQAIKLNPAAAASVIQNSNFPEILFIAGLFRFITRYDLFKSGIPNPAAWTQEEQFVLTWLFGNFLPGVTITPPLTKAQAILLIKQHAVELAFNVYQAVQASSGGGSSVNDIKSYLAQFLLYWAPHLANYRFQLANEVAGLYGNPQSLPRMLTPATLDITNWLPDANIDYVPTPLLQQAEMVSLIALIQPPTRAVHGFIGYDPWRQVDDLANGVPIPALEVVKIAIEQKGFVGVKLYPPMGFRATDNASLEDKEFPLWMVLPTNAKTLGPKLDSALDSLYAYCATNDVPIMAHCAGSEGTSDAYAARADPQYWKKVLDKPAYTNLRLNLGHFGGVWNFDNTLPTPTDPHVAWTLDVAAMIQSGAYPNLYTDIGDFAAVLDRGPAETANTQIIIAKLTALVASDPLLQSHVMYGTDWLMLGREPGASQYYKAMYYKMKSALAVSDVNDFLWGNASRYLGLATGKATRARLVKFYNDNGGDPTKLVQFGGP